MDTNSSTLINEVPEEVINNLPTLTIEEFSVVTTFEKTNKSSSFRPSYASIDEPRRNPDDEIFANYDFISQRKSVIENFAAKHGLPLTKEGRLPDQIIAGLKEKML